MATKDQTDALAAEVKLFRELLLASGYVHANSAGELRNDDGSVWVRTSYAGGEFQVDTWRRSEGSGWHEDHTKLRVHSHAVVTLRKLGAALAEYGKSCPTDEDWGRLPVAS